MLDYISDWLSGNLWFQLVLLLGVAIASSFLFARVGQPRIVGLIIVGIIIGPSLMGLIKVDPDDPEGWVNILANFGAIMILFLIGLECNIKEIYTRNNILIAIGGVSIPWISGFLVAELMLEDPGAGLSKFNQSLFIGTALVATSVAITASVMREMGIIGSKVAKTILGAAVIDDLIAMVVLAITAGVASEEGVNVFDITWITIIAILFVTLGSYLGSHFVIKVISRVEKRGIAHGFEESGFLLALTFALLYAAIAEMLHISAIVGAFIAGTSFSACEYRMRYTRFASVLEWVFAPIFFISLGIIANLRLLDEITYLFFGLALAGVAMASKIVGCGFPAAIFGMKKNEALSVGLGMAPRMEVVMIIALYAVNKYISNEIYSLIIIMALITVLITPILLKKTLKGIPKAEEEEVCEPI